MAREGAADRLNRLMRDLSTETVLLHQAIADRLGLSATDHKALGLLLDAGKPLTPGELGERTGLTSGAVTGIVDRLEQAGLVRRRRDAQDRRRVSLELVMDRVRRDVFPVFAQLANRMTALAAIHTAKDLGIITAFLERGVEISRAYRKKLQEPKPR